MKVVAAALVVVLLAWVMLICAATTTCSEINAPKSPPPPPPRPQPLELDLKDVSKATYSQLIATLRLKLEDPNQSRFGIPMLRKLSQSEYIFIKFTSAEERKSIVVAINKKDIYVQGYIYNGNQARCFLDIFKSGQCKVIFPEAQNPEKERNIGYDGSYPELQGKAGVGRQPADRRKVLLGMKALGKRIDEISTTPQSNFAKKEAELLLNAIQMFCEAVRFKYIENQVSDNIPNNFNPDYQVIGLENAWGKLSKAIAAAKSETESFKNPVELWDPQGNNWVVTKVKDIKGDMGLLNSVVASELPKWLLDDNLHAVSAQ